MNKFSIKEVLEKLNINRSTFYRYIQSNDILRQKRTKFKNKFFYTESFIEEFRNLLTNETPFEQKETIKQETEVETKKDSNLLSELKENYIGQLKELKNDKKDYKRQIETLQDQLSNQLSKNTEQTSKIESLLLKLLEISGDTKKLENKESLNSEVILKEVKDKIEKNNDIIKNDKKDNSYLKNQLEQANSKTKEFSSYINERNKLLNKLKKEYSSLKFFQVLKKAKLKKEIEQANNINFKFIQYI